MTQSELAEHLGGTDPTVANYEKGKTGDLVRLMAGHDPLPAVGPSRGDPPGVIKAVTEARKKLPEVPRRQLVERWTENELQAA
jgi:transcriptional regulator with XRE-family HTH domain